VSDAPQALPLPIVYARVLAADRKGEDWRVIARDLLGVDPDLDAAGAEAAWSEALEKARVYWVGGKRPESGSD